MEPVYVICEGETDAAVLAELLRPHPLSVASKVVSAGGRSTAVAMARTRAALGPGSAVALVLDSDIFDAGRTEAARRDLQELVRLASDGRPCETFLFAPQLEGIFFASPDQLAEALGIKGIPETTRVAARYVPKEELRALLVKSGKAYDANSVRRLVRAIGPGLLSRNATVGRLLDFISRVASLAEASSAV